MSAAGANKSKRPCYRRGLPLRVSCFLRAGWTWFTFSHVRLGARWRELGDSGTRGQIRGKERSSFLCLRAQSYTQCPRSLSFPLSAFCSKFKVLPASAGTSCSPSLPNLDLEPRRGRREHTPACTGLRHDICSLTQETGEPVPLRIDSGHRNATQGTETHADLNE